MPGNHLIAGIFTTSVACKVILLVLEALEKRGLLLESGEVAPEETAGILNRSFLWWFNPLLLAGYKQALTVDNLLTVDADIALERSKEEIRSQWAQGILLHSHSTIGSFILTWCFYRCSEKKG
jgi:hypothetical protein